MKKNVAGQKIGAQLVDATTGAAFTGSVTCYVTLDAGTQAIGSVGSGACTHEGNGYHTYAPSQGETNGDLAAFTFIGTGAVPATVQVFTNFPQTGDSFARLGAPAGASIAADLVTIDDFLDTEVAAIKAKTDLIPASPASTTNITAASGITVSAIGAGVITAASIAADAITDAKVAADVTIASVTGSVGSVTGSVGGNVVGSVASVTADVNITSNVQKNAALSNFAFVMTDSTTHVPATGKAVTVTRSIDGAAFAAGSLGAVTEIGTTGVYKVNFAAADLNGNVIILRATATGCDDTLERIITQP